MKKAYLLKLEGGGDIVIKLISKEIFHWINSDYQSKQSSYDEVLSEVIAHEMNKKHVKITRGSFENDRAIYASMHANGMIFDSIKELNRYLKKNEIELEDEYHGCIY